jgi:hypothetical protein
MRDITQLSDEELFAIIDREKPTVTPPMRDITQLSDEELSAIIDKEKPKTPIQALPLGLQQYAQQLPQEFEVADTTPVEKALIEGLKITPEMAGGVYGGITGARFGVPGSIIGGIAGAATGKEAQQKLGFEPDIPLKSTIKEATVEEAIGRAIAAPLLLGKRFIYDPVKNIIADKSSATQEAIPENAKKLFRKLRIIDESNKPTNLGKNPDLFINSRIFDPKDPTPKNIIDAQKNLFNERLLTVFEETGGAADAKRAQELSDIIAKTKGGSEAESKFLTNRRTINTTLQKKLSATSDQSTLDRNLGQALQSSFNNKLKSFNPKFNELNKQIVPLRPKVKYNAFNTYQKLQDAKPFIEESLDTKDTKKLYDTIDKYLLEKKPVKTVTAKALKNLENDLDPGTFSESKDVQQKIAGVTSGNILNVLNDMKIQNIRENPTANMTKLNALDSEFARLAAEKGDFVKSKIGRSLGLREGRQKMKALSPKQIANYVFESPDSIINTRKVLQEVNPDLIPVLDDAYKSRIVKDIFINGKINAKKLNTVLKDNTETIEEIAGGKYLENLKDAQMIATGLEASKTIGQALKAAPIEDLPATGLKAAVHPLYSRVKLFGGLLALGKEALGMGKMTDDGLFKAMQGEKAMRYIDNMSNTTLGDPQAYNNYVQFFREAAKIYNIDSEPVSEDEFVNAFNNALYAIKDETTNIIEK